MQPKGFGKKYFTLASIQAHSAHVTMTRIATKIESQYLLFSSEDEEKELLDEEELLLLESSLQSLSNGSHCSCLFTQYSRCKIKTHSIAIDSLSSIESLNPSNSPPIIF